MSILIINLGLRSVVMTIKNIRNVDLNPKELIYKAELIAYWFYIYQVPKWSAILAVVEDFKQAALSTREQETELLNGIALGAGALDEVAVATQRFVTGVASQTLKSSGSVDNGMACVQSRDDGRTGETGVGV